VTVTVKGMDIQTTTGDDGGYELRIPADVRTLVFSAIGYETQERNILNDMRLDISLTPITTNLDEVVIVGYGEQSRETVTNSISQVSAEEFDRAPGQNPLLQLQGKVAGLSLQVQNGQPGSSPQVFIRGGSSTSPEGDAPLFIVDGMISQGMRSIDDL